MPRGHQTVVARCSACWFDAVALVLQPGFGSAANAGLAHAWSSCCCNFLLLRQPIGAVDTIPISQACMYLCKYDSIAHAYSCGCLAAHQVSP